MSNVVDELLLARRQAHARRQEQPRAGSSAATAIDVDDLELELAPPPRQPPPQLQALPRPNLRIPREPIVIDDDDDDEMDDLLFARGPRRAPPQPRRHRLFSPPPPLPPAPGPAPPVPGIPERLRRYAHFNLDFGDLFRDLPAPPPFPPMPLPLGANMRLFDPHPNPNGNANANAAPPRIGLGGFIMRQAQQIYRTMGAGGIRVGLMDDQGWQRYDPAMFDEPAPPPKIQYKREWLFPKALPAGFTSNFDLEGGEVIDLSGDTPDPKGKGKRKAPPVAQRMLVCAKCVEPLRAGASDKSVRVWALRCGHVIDGRCLLALAEDPERAAAFAEIEPQASTSTSSSPSSSKRKQPARRVAKGRTTRGKKASAAKSAAAQEEETLVLAEHEWSCPVGSCGRKHASQLVKRASGPPQWVQKSGSGAIQLFV